MNQECDQDRQRCSHEVCPIAFMQGVPVAAVRRRRFSWAWVVPILAIGLVGYMVWSQVRLHQGERIVIRFADASGIRVGTSIMYRGVEVGVVRELELDHALAGVLVHGELTPQAQGLASAGTQFWVVYPEVSLERIAGLETLLGPNYIALRPGEVSADTPAEAAHSFVALDRPPTADLPSDGSLRLVLTTDRLGTLASGSPVLYREIKVGSVREAYLDHDSTRVIVTLDIEPKYRPLVHEKTRFWRSGGMGFNIGFFTGVSVKADSLQAAMSSSVSFATPSKKAGDLALPGDVFELGDEVDADWLKWSPKIELGG